MADALEIAQQTYANYEVAQARPPVLLLPDLVRLFDISVDDLLGIKARRRQTRTRTEAATTNRAAKPLAQGEAESGDGDVERRSESSGPLKRKNHA